MNKERLLEIKTKLAELRSEIDASENAEEIKQKGEEIAQLEKEREEIIEEAEQNIENDVEARAAELASKKVEDAKNKELEAREKVVLGSFGMKKQEQRKENEIMTEEIRKSLESKAELLRSGKAVTFTEEEVRAVTVSAGDLVLKQHISNKLDTVPFSEVSELIDSTDSDSLPGGESYKQPFTVTYGEGDYTDEGEAYKETEPTFDDVTIGKAKITAYTEITEEVVKLPAVNYVAEVMKNIKVSLRKKTAKQMISGAGTTETICGIYNAPVNVMPTNKDLYVSTIDEDTLDNIVLSYGGDEAIEGAATLILNKLDLADFNKVRLEDGKRAYKIEGDGGKGTITSDGSFKVNYVINSSVRPFRTAKDGEFTMIYGKLGAYKLTQFSPIEIAESRDYKFAEGKIAYRGSSFIGGNVAKYRGFVRIIKGTAPAETPSV
jgi:HK97 family phage major capsid protein